MTVKLTHMGSPVPVLDEAIRLADLGHADCGALLRRVFETFVVTIHSSAILTARIDLHLVFQGSGVVEGLVLHLCHGMVCQTPAVRVLHRAAPISTSECMRLTRGMGDPLASPDGGDAVPGHGADRLDVLLDEFGRGVSTLRCGFDDFVAAIRTLRTTGAVHWIVADFKIRPNPRSDNTVLAHWCANDECSYAPLRFVRMDGKHHTMSICGEEYEIVMPPIHPILFSGGK